MRLVDLTSPALAQLLAREPIALWPVGAVEPHGPHAPLGTDTLISEAMCERAAVALEAEGVAAAVLPALPFGVTRCGAGFAGAVGIDAAALKAVVAGVNASVLEQGFRRLAIVNNHFEPGQVQALREAAAETGALYLDLVRRANAERLTDEFRRGSCHAGRYETSLVLARRPELVDAEAMAGLPAVEVDMPAAMAAGNDDFRAMGMERAYCGAPAEASAAEGEETLETLTRLLVELVKEHTP
ncbi:MAG: creatininase family protein [Actinobacteria bacterium]|nr:creatininase family protein [Actinomycetota bacterium]